MGNGDLGFSGSGLELRVWVMQGTDGSVWRIREQTSNSLATEEFLYTPEGKVSLIRRLSQTPGDYDVGLPNSEYSWRYLWRSGRASIDHAPSDLFDMSSSGIEVYDGLLYFTGSGEHDTLKGAPVAEDVYAYAQTDQQYDSASFENTQLPGNGTTDAYAHPVGNGGWDTEWDAFWHPAHYGAMGRVTQPTWIRYTANTSRLVGIGALSIATAGLGATLLGAGLGAGIGGVDTALGGGSFAQGALAGSEFGMGLAAAGSLLPARVAFWGGVGLNVGLTGYGAYQSFSSGHYAQGAFRLATGAYFGLRQLGYDISFIPAPEEATVTLNSRLFPFRIVSSRNMLPARNGFWTGEPGNSGWVSEIRAVQQIVGDTPIQYTFDPATGRSYPNFGPWSQADVDIPNMTGNRASDAAAADELLAARWGWTPDEVLNYRSYRELTWHHHENLRTMQLVPKPLNKLPHVGGASAARGS